MDQQVSPAVVVIVLILIVAILVGLYFLVVERGPQMSGDEDSVMEMAPPDEGEIMPDADAVEADGDDQGREYEGDEQTDVDDDAEADGADETNDDVGDDSGQ